MTDLLERATVSLSLAQASLDGALIQRAKNRYNIGPERHANRLWIEALLTHLDEPLNADVTLSDGHELGDMGPLKLLIKSEDAANAIGSIFLQPVDMRWDGTGHEREKQGRTNGISGVVADAEIRNQNELWVAVCFWANDFKDKTFLLLDNLPYMGMSIDMAGANVYLSDKFPSTAVFGDPRFDGGAFLYRTLAADKQSHITAIANSIVDSQEEKKIMSELNFDTVVGLLAQKDEKLTEQFKVFIQEKDNRINDLQKQLEEKGNLATASVTKLKDELKTEVESELKAAFDKEKSDAIAAAITEETKKFDELNETKNSLQALVDELKPQITKLEEEKNNAVAELNEIKDKAEKEQMYESRLKTLNEIHPFAEAELTDEVKEGIVTASEEKFETLKLQRELAKVRAGATANKTDKKDEEEEGRKVGGSGLAQFKGVAADSDKISSLSRKFANAIR